MSSHVAPVTLAALQAPVRAGLERVEKELRRIIEADFELIREVNSHLLQMQGKLFRPTILLLADQATGSTPRAVTLAAVIELIHLATLVHDDSVDHSVLRRGMPTINSLFSHQVSVIMGDYLYSRAVIELVRLDDLEPLRVLSRVTNEMTVGEMRQLLAHDPLHFSEEQYDLLIRARRRRCSRAPRRSARWRRRPSSGAPCAASGSPSAWRSRSGTISSITRRTRQCWASPLGRISGSTR
jgi:octaprenyl-diphosphate synthase